VQASGVPSRRRDNLADWAGKVLAAGVAAAATQLLPEEVRPPH
jgi:hypothetical protein